LYAHCKTISINDELYYYTRSDNIAYIHTRDTTAATDRYLYYTWYLPTYSAAAVADVVARTKKKITQWQSPTGTTITVVVVSAAVAVAAAMSVYYFIIIMSYRLYYYRHIITQEGGNSTTLCAQTRHRDSRESARCTRCAIV